MKNLFICHSQSHLILASGLSRGRYAGDENHLILFKDFNLRDVLKSRLEEVFKTCLFLSGTYPASENMTMKGRIKWYRADIKILKTLLVDKYDRVFAVCDWTYPVQYAIQCCIKNNPNAEVSWLEDGILPYFANSNSRSGLDKYAFTLFLRRLLFRDILRLGKVYDRDFDEMGGLSIFKNAYVSYPDAVREPYKSKKQLISISTEEFVLGVSSLYDLVDIPVPDNSILLVMDKLDTYLYPDKVQAAVSSVLDFAESYGISVYCKLHPREDSLWEVLNRCVMLDKTVGAESMYLSLSSRKDSLRVIGVKSAGLMTAVKMGLHVETLFPYSGEKNDELVSFFDSMQIGVFNNSSFAV